MSDLTVFGYLIGEDIRRHVLLDYPDASDQEIRAVIDHGQALWVHGWFTDVGFDDQHTRIQGRVFGSFDNNKKSALSFTAIQLSEIDTAPPESDLAKWTLQFMDFTNFSAGARHLMRGCRDIYIYDVWLHRERSESLKEFWSPTKIYFYDGQRPIVIQLPTNVVF